MATNCTINGNNYYKIDRKVGKKLKNGKWVDKYKTFYGSCKRDAEDKYEDYIKQREKGVDEDRCLGELMDIFIREVFIKSNLANSTKKKYVSAYKRLLQGTELAGWKISEITALHLQEFYNSLRECYSTRRALHNLIRRFYKYAELNGIARDITGCLEISKDKAKKGKTSGVIVWPDEDVKVIIKALEGSTLRLLIVLAVNTGLRFGELLALTYDDIKGNMLYVTKQLSEIASIEENDGKTLHLTDTKTISSFRVIPLTDTVLIEIKKHKIIQKRQMLENGYRTNYLFTTSNGTFYYQRNITRSLKRLYKRIGIEYRKFHAYRATFATNLARAGVPIEQTAQLLGHTDIEMTAKYYVDVSAEQKLSAVEKIVKYTLEAV